jgi:hypothetical protein
MWTCDYKYIYIYSGKQVYSYSVTKLLDKLLFVVTSNVEKKKNFYYISNISVADPLHLQVTRPIPS